MCDKYNGWTNYETWNCKLWIDNNQSEQEFWRERAQDAWETTDEDTTFSHLENATFRLAESLKDYFTENMPEVTGFYADIMGAAFSSVNWHEIAKSIIDENDPKDM